MEEYSVGDKIVIFNSNFPEIRVTTITRITKTRIISASGIAYSINSKRAIGSNHGYYSHRFKKYVPEKHDLSIDRSRRKAMVRKLCNKCETAIKHLRKLNALEDIELDKINSAYKLLSEVIEIISGEK